MSARDDTTSSWWSKGTLRMLGGEVAALTGMALAFPFRVMDELRAADDPSDTPVILVHGLFGHATNFGPLRHFLQARGIRRLASFSYLPRLDYQRIATGLAERIDAVRRDTGARQVDVVAHSLGGLTARYLIDTQRSAGIRRLVTLGSPYWTTPNPPQELAIFADGDAIVPPPGRRPSARTLVIRNCGHLGLLRDRRALVATARFLGLRALAPATGARDAA